MLISLIAELSNNWTTHTHPIRNFTHWAWAIWDLRNHDLSWIIPDPVSRQTATVPPKSIRTISVRARTSYVNIPEWGQHGSNCRMPYLISIFVSFRGTYDQPNKTPDALFWCVANTLLNISNGEIQWPGMLITWNICQVSLVGCTNNWHNGRSSRKLILRMTPQIAHFHFASDWATFRVSKVEQCNMEGCLK